MHDDDVWGSDDEGEAASGRPSGLDREWETRQAQFHTLGYRDGVEAGKNSSAQEGFNVGYAQATPPGCAWGVTRGLCSAFAALPPAFRASLVADDHARGRLDTLASSIHAFSSLDAQRSFYRDLTNGWSRSLGASPGGGELGFGGINRGPEPHGVGVGERETSNNYSSRSPPPSRSSTEASELEELEKNVRREFEGASIKTSF